MENTAANPSRWRRRNLLVHRPIQLRFIGLLFLQMGIILAALGLLVHSHVQSGLELAAGIPLGDPVGQDSMNAELVTNLHGFHVRGLTLIAATGAMLLLFGLFASHKLAGPVVKLEGYLTSLAAGDYSRRIAFRRKDHLDDFAAGLNRMAESMERREQRVTALAAELARKCQEIDGAPDRSRLLSEMGVLVAVLKEAV